MYRLFKIIDIFLQH